MPVYQGSHKMCYQAAGAILYLSFSSICATLCLMGMDL